MLRPAPQAERLLALHHRLGAALQSFGMPPEQRRFRPHVTLARKAVGATIPPPAQLHWRVTEGFVLVQSVGHEGYQVLQRFA